MTESLRDLLGKLKAIDDDLAPEDFDPAQIVGDIADKVDAIKWRLDEWYALAAMIEDEWITQLEKRRQALIKKAERLEEYVKVQMLAHKFEKIPGEMFTLGLRELKSVKIDHEAGPEDYVKNTAFVIQKIAYQWDKKKVKEAIDSGVQLTFASVETGKHIRFSVKAGAKKGK